MCWGYVRDVLGICWAIVWGGGCWWISWGCVEGVLADVLEDVLGICRECVGNVLGMC